MTLLQDQAVPAAETGASRDMPSLRARIFRRVGLTALGLAVIVTVAAAVLIRLSDDRLSAATLDNQALLFSENLKDSAAPIRAALQGLADDPLLAPGQSLEGEDVRPAVRTLLAGRQEMLASARIQRVDVLTSDGRLVASTARAGAFLPMIGPALLDGLPDGGERILMVGTGTGTAPLLALAMKRQNGPVLVAGGAISGALDLLGRQLHAAALLVDGRGSVLAGEQAGIWDAIGGPRRPELPGIDYAGYAGRHYQMVTTPLGGGAVATSLVTIRDVTFETEQRSLVVGTTLCVGGVLILLLVAGLYGSVSAVLSPLNEVTHVVRALARGDTLVSLEGGREVQEIEHIVAAVEVFRRKLIELERLDFRAAREREHHERDIRDQMMALAATLDGDAKEQVLEDLALINHTVGSRETLDIPASGLLSAAFSRMTERLSEQHGERARLLAERTRDLAIVRDALAEREQLTRLRQEMEIARSLQLASLPAVFPPFPERSEFDLFALTRPAKEVGGDFYDFFLLDRDRLVVAIGDASGKGVPAALFAAMARSLVRAYAGLAASPAACLASVNQVLCVDNPTMMFVTALLGIYHIPTGRLSYASAGHNPAILLKNGAAPVMLPHVAGVALGVAEEAEFADAEIQISAGDRLLLYTDGVTEALDAADDEFQNDRLLASVATGTELAVKPLVDIVLDEVTRFMGETPQFDDITLLALSIAGDPRA